MTWFLLASLVAVAGGALYWRSTIRAHARAAASHGLTPETIYLSGIDGRPVVRIGLLEVSTRADGRGHWYDFGVQVWTADGWIPVGNTVRTGGTGAPEGAIDPRGGAGTVVAKASSGRS